MSKISEIRGSLFEAPEVYRKIIPDIPIVHCISADYVLGKGFALEIEQRYQIRTALKIYGDGTYPGCLVCKNIINMITKTVYNSKPTYETFNSALELVRYYCIQNNLNKVIMPRIGSGLDRLDWEICKDYIIKNIVNYGIEVVVYYK